MKAIINSIVINNWAEYKRLVSSKKMQSWIFRGQANSKWPVESALTRVFKKFKVNKGAWAHQEERLLRIFKRKAHHYLDHLPGQNESFEWLSLMQHFGAPTRLIDFTFSPYVAAFFAIHRSIDDAAVWCLFPPPFDNKGSIVLNDGKEIDHQSLWMRTESNYENNFIPGRRKFLVLGEPEKMNQRLIAQAGTFVIPGVINTSLEDIILTNYPEGKNHIIKIVLKKRIRDEAMFDLYKSNITEATLFPGIDGMARSLAYDCESHWAYNPKTMTKIKGFNSPPFGLPKGVK